jgi:ribose 1,5-bisphosphokinase
MATLFYVVGASGSGKDTLMNYARKRLDPAAPVLFAHRYITRPADAGGENHVALSRDEFLRMRDHGLFALNWESHGHAYGIGHEIESWLGRGLNVVVNGSRAYLAEASRRIPALCVVQLTVSPAVLRARLESRGRESPVEIESRLARAAEFFVEHPNLITIRNNGPVAESGAEFLKLLCSTEQPVALSNENSVALR